MPIQAQHYMTTAKNSPYYAAQPNEVFVAGGDAPVQTNELPAGWLLHRFGGWESWTPRDWEPRLQGWKIHISTTPEEAAATLADVTAICVERGTAFKFLPTLAVLIDSSSKQAHRGSSGKFITIYPVDDADLTDLLARLTVTLDGRQGPYILSDLRIGRAPVFVRYGAFLALDVPGAEDERVASITRVDLCGLEPDQRQPRFHVPDGVQVPEVVRTAMEAAEGKVASRLDEFTAITPLHFSNAGGVYRATLPDGQQRVLREARPHAGLDGRGRCALTRQRTEQHVLEQLAGLPGVQRLRGQFTAWEHSYLELDYVEGTTLTSWVVAGIGLQQEQPEQYARQVARIGRQLVDIVQSIHDRGWALGDVHAGNVLVGPDLAVTVVDLEDAQRLDQPREIGFRVFEYCAETSVDARAADWFAIARALMLCFYSDWEAEAVSPDFWTSCRHMVAEAYGPEVDALLAEVEARYPAGTRSVLASDVQLHHQPGGPQLSDLVEALMAGVDWSRDFGTDGSYPGDPHPEDPVAVHGLAHGRAGVLLAQQRTGHPVDQAALEVVTTVAGTWPAGAEPNLMHGQAGLALALSELGRPEAGARAAAQALETAQGLRRLELAEGQSGAVLAAIEVAGAAGDEKLLADALGCLERIHRTAATSASAQRSLGLRRGLHHGTTGLALVDVVAHLATGEDRYLDWAREDVMGDVSTCVAMANGQVMVPDTVNGRVMPYLDWGSAGVWMVAELVERLTGEPVLDEAQRSGLAETCSSDIFVYPTLHHGRAGTMVSLLAAGPGHRAEVERQVGLVRASLFELDEKAFVIGEGMLRVSSDLATGAAGVALALHAHRADQPYLVLPVSRASAERLPRAADAGRTTTEPATPEPAFA
ncbi:MAG: class III lanthionine synthetase LanKC [Luteococcus sp.]|uniref:class III lanthionine synthetase LanKC n=1 Tax=Luteococcus sp. TaxID=1969402 RepID=UPI00264A12E5|nr:class III lanthionine synthetase LanKC [Luteococcus sp.]MDN5562472.1 class III lanthionine synthetase LanKC [Luteococcus sp.]